MKFIISLLFLIAISLTACAPKFLVSKETLQAKNYEEVYGLIDVSEVKEKPEQMPQYPGGNGGLIKDIQENLVYPETAQQEKIEGNVIVAFTVNKKGELENVSVDKGVSPALNSAAVNALGELQPWYPAFNEGESTSVRLKTLVTFRLPQNYPNKVTQ